MSYLRELRVAVEELEKGNPVALVIVTKKIGSAPRDVGARMVVRVDGSVVGTLGGGVFERMIVEEALRALREGRSRAKRYAFREEASRGAEKTGLICGGETEVFIDVLKPAPRLLIVGAGHLAQSIARVASEVGFRIAVTDRDEGHANRERFPMAEEIVVDEPERGVEKLGPREGDLLVIVYGGVEEDYRALLKALETPVRYIGLLGSRRKCQEFLRRLRERGYREEELRGRLYMPLGLDIGADSPEEIAVAAVAELISVLRGGKLKHLSIV